jgi:cellobiose-specific phosphotransferase system component IIC
MNTENTGALGSRGDIHMLTLMAATALGVYLCYRMALPFVPALTWALALAVVFMRSIYPILVGNRLRLHTIPAFMAIIGGLSVFGASGLILGPVTLTVSVLLLKFCQHRSPRSHPR